MAHGVGPISDKKCIGPPEGRCRQNPEEVRATLLICQICKQWTCVTHRYQDDHKCRPQIRVATIATKTPTTEKTAGVDHKHRRPHKKK